MDKKHVRTTINFYPLNIFLSFMHSIIRTTNEYDNTLCVIYFLLFIVQWFCIIDDNVNSILLYRINFILFISEEILINDIVSKIIKFK